jgi:hypothetical protein
MTDMKIDLVMEAARKVAAQHPTFAADFFQMFVEIGEIVELHGVSDDRIPATSRVAEATALLVSIIESEIE